MKKQIQYKDCFEIIYTNEDGTLISCYNSCLESANRIMKNGRDLMGWTPLKIINLKELIK
jgi:hypothetical protein